MADAAGAAVAGRGDMRFHPYGGGGAGGGVGGVARKALMLGEWTGATDNPVDDQVTLTSALSAHTRNLEDWLDHLDKFWNAQLHPQPGNAPVTPRERDLVAMAQKVIASSKEVYKTSLIVCENNLQTDLKNAANKACLGCAQGISGSHWVLLPCWHSNLCRHCAEQAKQSGKCPHHGCKTPVTDCGQPQTRSHQQVLDTWNDELVELRREAEAAEEAGAGEVGL